MATDHREKTLSARWPSLGTPRTDPAQRDHWRTAGYWTDESLGDVLERSALAWPDRIAVETAEGSCTFADLQARASAVARTLLHSGVRPGDVVCWMLPTGPDAISVASAIWRIGAVSSPVVPLSGVREMINIIEQVRPRAIVTVAEHRGRELPAEFDEAIRANGLDPVARLVIGTPSRGWRDATAEGPGAISRSVHAADPAEPCLILFTSGTESAAKAVLHSATGIHHELRTTIADWGITFRDRMFMASPLTHITGLLQGFLIPARVGASAVLMDRWNGEEGMRLIEATGATYMAGAAPFLREVLAAYRASGLERSTLRQYCSGGAAVSPDLIDGIADFGVAAYRAWGMTELPTATLANELDSLEHRSTTDGRLAPGVELRVLADDGSEVPAGATGELQLRGPEMMLGYVRAEHNDKAFTEDGWMRTGDLGSLGEDGYVRITGRLKEIINRGGEKFSAREIEDAVAQHPDITATAVVAVPGGRLGEQIAVAVVTSRPDLTLEEIGRTVTGSGLSKYKQPERLLVVDSLPTNPTGKTDKNRLIEMFGTEPE
ncbi:CoA-dependent ligase [Microbacterium sp. Root61]|uniref:class I adenylate-forming enzyme family protein n=1 Tax=Microbacterium sp. Root61 TaxID=1736570 RepID=UPI0006F32617|nr:AMP-binding protein [Microbacterium sp. Root61]KRA24676.1 CoA-dependent ligase [Microbacterium sp. Root61]